MLHFRFLTRLRFVFGVRRNFVVVFLFFLHHFFVVRDVAWISHVGLSVDGFR